MLNGNGYYTHYTDLRNHIIKSWDTNDLRYGMNIGFYVFGKDAYGEYTCLLTKYTDPNAQGNGANVSIPLIRYTDAMLRSTVRLVPVLPIPQLWNPLKC